jgi:hypothetical protein
MSPAGVKGVTKATPVPEIEGYMSMFVLKKNTTIG